MPQVYLNKHILTVLADARELRDLDEYQRIKSLVNSRYHVLSRDVCWQQVQQQCTELALHSGIDFLASSYLAVAATKEQGVEGFAWGLELLQSVYLADLEHKSLPAHRKREMLEWVAHKVMQELEAAPVTFGQLRALYRCERSLQELYELCQRFQVNDVPNLEAVACVIFEHIDSLETQCNFQSEASDVVSKVVAPAKERRTSLLLLFFALICCLIAVAYVALQGEQNEQYWGWFKDINRW